MNTPLPRTAYICGIPLALWAPGTFQSSLIGKVGEKPRKKSIWLWECGIASPLVKKSVYWGRNCTLGLEKDVPGN